MRRDCQQSYVRDALWHKDAIIYALHVKTFFDSNGDGIGDFKGLTEKLDYLELRIITDLVINHTSDQHPWFKAARRVPAASPKRDFYEREGTTCDNRHWFQLVTPSCPETNSIR